MEKRERSPGEHGRHDCLLYRDKAQKLDLMLQNAASTLNRGERCLLILHREVAAQVLEGVSRAGIDPGEALRRGQLHLGTPEECEELADPAALVGYLKRALPEEAPSGTVIVVDGDIWAPSLQYEDELDAVASEAVRILCLHRVTSRLPATRIILLMQSHRHTTFGDSIFQTVPRGIDESVAEVRYLNEACSLLLQNEGEAVYFTDHEGRIVLFNNAAGALFGTTAEEARGRLLHELLSPHDAAQVREAEVRALESGDPVTFRVESGPRGKRHLWVVTTGAYRDPGGAGYSFGIIRDLTTLNQTEQKLRFTAHLVNVIGQAVIATDRRGTIIFWNRAAEELYGWKAREVLGRDVTEVVASRGWLDLSAEILAKLAKGQKWSGEFMVRRRDQSEFLAHISTSPMRDSAGRLIGIIGISFDVTERKKAEEALAASEERFRRYFELGLIGISITSPDRKIIEVNDKVCEMLGYSREELLTMHWPELTHPDDLTLSDVVLQKILAGETDNYILEKRYIRKDGAVIDAIISVSCLRRKDGSVESFVALLQDITDRKRAEREIAAYQQQLHQMTAEMYRMEEEERKQLATVLHDEIGQNLALSKMKLESLKTSEDRDALRQEIDQIGELLDDVIANTRTLTTQLRPPVLHELGLEAAVESLCEELQDQTGLAIYYQDDGKGGALPEPLSTILFRGVREILFNVLKHANASAAEVSLARDVSQITITVADNGIGFDTGKRRPKESFGLFSLAERMLHVGGRVEVRSAPGEGTRVELFAPLSAIPRETGHAAITGSALRKTTPNQRDTK